MVLNTLCLGLQPVAHFTNTAEDTGELWFSSLSKCPPHTGCFAELTRAALTHVLSKRPGYCCQILLRGAASESVPVSTALGLWRRSPKGNRAASLFLNSAELSGCHREQLPRHSSLHHPTACDNWGQAVDTDLLLLSHLPRKGPGNRLHFIAKHTRQTGGINHMLILRFHDYLYILEKLRP